MTYLFRDPATGHTKIGYSRAINRRARELERQHPGGFMLREYRGYRKHEADLHAAFKHKNVVNEWFDLTDEDVAECDELMKDGAERVRERLRTYFNVAINSIYEEQDLEDLLDEVEYIPTEPNRFHCVVGEDVLYASEVAFAIETWLHPKNKGTDQDFLDHIRSIKGGYDAYREGVRDLQSFLSADSNVDLQDGGGI